MIELHDARGQRGQRPANGADSHTQRSHDAYIELLQLGRLSSRRRFVEARHLRRRRAQLIGRRRIGGSGALGDLFFDHPDQIFVRGPERLANADRVIDDLVIVASQSRPFLS